MREDEAVVQASPASSVARPAGWVPVSAIPSGHGVFSRENDREEERVHDSQVSDPGAFSRGAGMAPPVAVRQQSELDAAAGMVEQEVASLEDLLPTLFERYAAVMAPADAAEKLMDEPRPSFASPAADRLAHVAARVGSVRAMLASFREAGQA